jgi:hypothetical protein
MTATRCLAFATTKRVVDRVHSHTAGLWAYTLPTVTTSLTDREQLKLSITHLTDGRPSISRDPAHLSRGETESSINFVTAYELDAHASTTSYFAALTRAQLDIVDYRSNWDSAQRQSITYCDIGANT